MAFNDIPGNARIKEILRSALRRKSVLPSLLFSGPEGVGQRETALELAKSFNCETQSDDACGVCVSCKAITAGNHPDVIDVKSLPRKTEKSETDEKEDAENSADDKESDSDEEENGADDAGKKTKKILIAQMRKAEHLARLKPMIGRKRIFLIDDASEMNEATSNASLKILEEPPEFTQFILVTANVDLLLPTIVSRCQNFAFGPIKIEEIAEILRNRGFAADRAGVIASLVRGNYQKALTADWDEFFEERGEAWRLFRAILTGENGAEFLRTFAGGGRKNPTREDMEKVLENFRGFGRDLLLLGEREEIGGLFNPDLENGLRELASVIEPERALRLVRAVDAAIASLDKFANIRLVTSVLFAQMTG